MKQTTLYFYRRRNYSDQLLSLRKKKNEIGICRVVGTLSDIAIMLSTDFFNLVPIAVVIVFPLAW